MEEIVKLSRSERKRVAAVQRTLSSTEGEKTVGVVVAGSDEQRVWLESVVVVFGVDDHQWLSESTDARPP